MRPDTRLPRTTGLILFRSLGRVGLRKASTATYKNPFHPKD